jgi:hypothetical protein
MKPWQIKALEPEVSVLKHLDGFVHEHALYFLIGAIYLLLAFWRGYGAVHCDQREEDPPLVSGSLFFASAGTAATAPRHVRPISAAAPFGALRSR